MNIKERLCTNHENLQNQYRANVETVLDLQATLLRDILLTVEDELDLGPDATEWAKKWLYDTLTLFRILKRNNFTRSFTLEAVRKNLLWRLSNLRSPLEQITTNFLQCLPSHIMDPFDRPIIVLKMVAFNQASDAIRPWVLHVFELLRLNLERLNGNVGTNPVLQYIVLLDLDGLLLQNLNIELVAWTIREVIPRFPGMLAGVFILNYSWTHSSLWNVVKRVLPPAALSRVFFPTSQELLHYFTPSSLPEDYGGTLPFLTQLDDPLWPNDIPTATRHHTIAARDKIHTPEARRSMDDSMAVDTIIQLPSTSLLNPFFGYPVSQSSNSILLPHGRRRKRDLAGALAFLFWMRWRKHITLSLVLATLMIGIKKSQLRGPFHLHGRLLG
ncbi:hypothetical protein AX14_008379 [Amanita brunnescens Koide BX004]|nr:hypothetical protein AX14_008379 [Amanita brunnescens Koide BX004]